MKRVAFHGTEERSYVGMPHHPPVDSVPGCVAGMLAREKSHDKVYNGEVSERSKEHAWKVCIPHGIEGSNPSLSANSRL